MEDASKLNVNPPTVHNAAWPEPKIHGKANIAVAPANPAKLPLALCTVGMAPLSSNQVMTCDAGLTVSVSNSTPPAKVMAPVSGTARACWTQSAQLINPSARKTKILLLDLLFIVS